MHAIIIRPPPLICRFRGQRRSPSGTASWARFYGGSPGTTACPSRRTPCASRASVPLAPSVPVLLPRGEKKKQCTPLGISMFCEERTGVGDERATARTSPTSLFTVLCVTAGTHRRRRRRRLRRSDGRHSLHRPLRAQPWARAAGAACCATLTTKRWTQRTAAAERVSTAALVVVVVVKGFPRRRRSRLCTPAQRQCAMTARAVLVVEQEVVVVVMVAVWR